MSAEMENATQKRIIPTALLTARNLVAAMITLLLHALLIAQESNVAAMDVQEAAEVALLDMNVIQHQDAL